MTHLVQRLAASCLLLGLLLALLVPRAHAGAYEAELPANLATTPDMCALLPCAEVFPGATHFSARKGQPSYVEAYDNDSAQKKLLGYVMLSTDITDTPAYSGKPVVTLIGMDLAGRFVGVKVLKHSEPILLLGIPEAALTRFNDQYLGKFVGDKLEIGSARPGEGVIGLDAISGATVTGIAQNQVVTMAGTAVARQTGILAPTVRAQARFIDRPGQAGWQALADEGSVQPLLVRPQDVGLPRGGSP